MAAVTASTSSGDTPVRLHRRDADACLERACDVRLRGRVDPDVLGQVCERLPVARDRVRAVDPPVAPVVEHPRAAGRRRAGRTGDRECHQTDGCGHDDVQAKAPLAHI